MLAALALFVFLPLATLAQSEPKDAVEYEIFIACPGSTNGRCPVQAWDNSNALGSPSIAVDPYNVNNMMIHSLHGQPGPGPDERSRTGLPFTTHVSNNHGASWRDKYFFGPGLPQNATGEHPSLLMDPYGGVFVSSVFTIPDQDGNNPYNEYLISAQKFPDYEHVIAHQNGAYNAETLHPTFPYNRIGQTWYVYEPITDHAVLLWNEQVRSGPSAATKASHRSDPVQGLLDEARRMVARTLPPGHAVPASGSGEGSETSRDLITWRWTTPTYGDPYHAPSNTIAPCATSTNPVVSEGWVYVGCLVAKDQGPVPWNPKATPGEIHMFRFKPGDPEATYIGQAPLSGGQPKLGVRSDGRLALMTTEVLPADANSTTRVRLDGVYGQIGARQNHVEWGEVRGYGPALRAPYANMPLTEVNIQDMIYREYSGVIHMIFKRVADWPQDALSGYRPAFSKEIIAIDETYGVLEQIDLGIGALAHRQKDTRLYNNPASLYNDLSDDFLELPPAEFRYKNRPLGEFYQRIFYAVGNYGMVDFAELIEVTELRGPAAAGLPNPPPPPNPAPAATANLSIVTAGALTASALTVGTAATMKRKSHVRAGRKK